MMGLMQGDPAIGMSTCRLEKRDGTLDHASKSNFPTPLGAVSHWLGLAHRFGGRFAQYHAPELGERERRRRRAGQRRLHADPPRGDRAGRRPRRRLLALHGRLRLVPALQLAGWRIVYDGRVSSLHVKGGTTGARRSHRGLRHNVAFHRSMGRFYRKFEAGRNPLSTPASTSRSGSNSRSR